jgi:hypothetical protein
MAKIAHCMLLALAALVVASTCLAQTMYRWVDAQGVVHYSDQPQPGAQAIPLPSAQTYRAPPAAPAAPLATTSPAPTASAGYQSCAITQPAADANLFAPEALNISVQVIPALRPGDQVNVTFDGATLPSSAGAMNFELSAPERGTHTISAVVLSAEGQTLCSAAAVSFSVQRPSLNSPQSPAKGH